MAEAVVYVYKPGSWPPTQQELKSLKGRFVVHSFHSTIFQKKKLVFEGSTLLISANHDDSCTINRHIIFVWDMWSLNKIVFQNLEALHAACEDAAIAASWRRSAFFCSWHLHVKPTHSRNWSQLLCRQWKQSRPWSRPFCQVPFAPTSFCVCELAPSGHVLLSVPHSLTQHRSQIC